MCKHEILKDSIDLIENFISNLNQKRIIDQSESAWIILRQSLWQDTDLFKALMMHCSSLITKIETISNNHFGTRCEIVSRYFKTNYLK